MTIGQRNDNNNANNEIIIDANIQLLKNTFLTKFNYTTKSLMIARVIEQEIIYPKITQ